MTRMIPVSEFVDGCGCPDTIWEDSPNEIRWLNHPTVIQAMATGQACWPVGKDTDKSAPFAYQLCPHGCIRRFPTPILAALEHRSLADILAEGQP